MARKSPGLWYDKYSFMLISAGYIKNMICKLQELVYRVFDTPQGNKDTIFAKCLSEWKFSEIVSNKSLEKIISD